MIYFGIIEITIVVIIYFCFFYKNAFSPLNNPLPNSNLSYQEQIFKIFSKVDDLIPPQKFKYNTDYREKNKEDIERLFKKQKISSKNGLKILFVNDYKKYYSKFMDRVFFSEIRAFQRSKNIEYSALWGPGFPEYNDKLSLKQNIINRFGKVKFFDFIYVFGVVPNGDVYKISKEIPIIQREQECHGLRCEQYFEMNNSSLVFLTYGKSIYDYSNTGKKFYKKRIFAHVPHGVDGPVVFSGTPLLLEGEEKKNIGSVGLFGSISHSAYPLRHQVAKLIENNKINNGFIYKHPGYWLEKTPENLEKQFSQFSKVIRKTDICICSTTIFNYALKKFVEYAAAGCFIASNSPFENYDAFDQFVYSPGGIKHKFNQFNKDGTVNYPKDKTIIKNLNKWSSNKMKNWRRLKAALGQRIVMENFTTDINVEVMIHYMITYLNGNYGFYHPYPVYNGCRPKNFNTKINKKKQFYYEMDKTCFFENEKGDKGKVQEE